MILTVQEAAHVLDCESIEDMPEKVSSIFLPAIDNFLKDATGKDWAADLEIDPTAKMVAGVLLVRWTEDSGMIGQANDSGVIGLIAQLKAKALLEIQAGE